MTFVCRLQSGTPVLQ